jgi:hypothetical protein
MRNARIVAENLLGVKGQGGGEVNARRGTQSTGCRPNHGAGRYMMVLAQLCSRRRESAEGEEERGVVDTFGTAWSDG